MFLEHHWQDNNKHVEDMQNKLDNIISELSDVNRKNLEDLLNHYYYVGRRDKEDENNIDL